MIDHFVVFSKTGTVLWTRSLCKLNGDPVDTLINRVLMEDRAGEKKYINDSYAMQWAFENKLDLVFVVVYQKILQLLYIDELLESVRKEFIAMFREEILQKKPVSFDAKFIKLLKDVELRFAEKQTRKAPRAFNSTRKAKGVASSGTSKPAGGGKGNADKNDESNDDGAESDGKAANKFGDLESEVALKSQVRKMRTGPGRKAGKKKAASEETTTKKSGKKMTKWDDSKLSKKEILELDRSAGATAEEEQAQLLEKRAMYIGDEEASESEVDSDSDENSAQSSGAETDASEGGWSFSKTQLGDFLSAVSGNKTLTREDLEPVVTPMRQHLISKNVAAEVAEELCESVLTTLVGRRLESFTRVTTVVRQAMEAALVRILTPKKSTDVLREILDAKASGRAYSIVFVGVNGVGKSTSLSKVCYYLKSKGVKVLIAACDTFRSGAVEQLNQHAKVLDVPLFEKGYAKDPASVAKEAIKYGTENGFDCVLIDTAGRMQNNEPLMRALAKLVSNNEPDLVLFVGEALVGNDGIDQLSMFDRALADYSDRREPHRVDGIVITKFDTIDDKVGAAVSMVYKTGQPIMFVGTGQKYTHLKKLNVRTILRHLLQISNIRTLYCHHLAMWVLDVVDANGASAGQSFYLLAGEWSIGRKKCHFNFNADSSISRSHAIIRVGTLSTDQLNDPTSRQPLVLVDLQSRFGSFVNQEHCFGERELKNGDEITFGAKRTVLRVRYQVFVLVASRIQRANRAAFHDACQRLGMHVVTSESKNATHCIMDPGRVVATVKVLWALVYNQPVVCTTWIYAMLDRKSLSESLPQLITVMGGVVIAAYKENEDDQALLREIEGHAGSRHVLIVEPLPCGGFSSGATFTTIQELAASVIFVKAPMPHSQQSFSNSIAGQHSNSMQISSFPEHLSLPPRASVTIAETATQSQSHHSISEEKIPKREVVDASTEDHSEGSRNHSSQSLQPPVTRSAPIQVKEEEVVAPADGAAAPSDDRYLGYGASTDNEPAAIAPREEDGWVASRSARTRAVQREEGEEAVPVVSMSLVVKRFGPDSGVPEYEYDAGAVNFKKFKKGNGYARRSRATSVAPRHAVVGVTVDNADRQAILETLGVLEEQERIAEELFAMVERRGKGKAR
ncbi:TPA: hypothetical protein N0F65_005897 [Lagenidium giganteum]|uniref:Signal recognition particle receptor subunit alpha n=1 Tax=Lagenidium giganteum TaxID=4803 RepID=A0AAV2ZE79_9STRA|nr:TPA: hypothetical protein N0F65_005897 [Lagenidium giganteum]